MKPRQIAAGVVIFGLAGLVYAASIPLKRSGKTWNCQSNLKQIGLGMMQYARDYDEQFPRAANWAQDLNPYLPHSSVYVQGAELQQTFRCPATENYYAYNAYFDRVAMKQDKSPRTSPLVFDIESGQLNQSDDGARWPSPPIHTTLQTSGNNVLFADGHVELRGNKPAFRAFAPYEPEFGEVLTKEMLRRREKSKPVATARPNIKTKQKP